MKKELIEKIMEQQQKISDRNYQRYQECGEQRYYRTYIKAEDILDICRMALNASSDHDRRLFLEAEVNQMAGAAVRILHDQEPVNKEIVGLLKNLKAISRVRDPYEAEKKGESR